MCGDLCATVVREKSICDNILGRFQIPECVPGIPDRSLDLVILIFHRSTSSRRSRALWIPKCPRLGCHRLPTRSPLDLDIEGIPVGEGPWHARVEDCEAKLSSDLRERFLAPKTLSRKSRQVWTSESTLIKDLALLYRSPPSVSRETTI